MSQNSNKIIGLRSIENLHIVFWLFKDVAWCLNIKLLGLTMIIPTLAVSVYITLKNKNIVSELYHNLAVSFWIIANSYWMISEFYHFDSRPLWGYTYKHIAVLPFAAGIFLLAYYYLFLRRKPV